MLNKYIKQTVHQGTEVLYNSVTKKALPLVADPCELERHFFLEGQERDSIISKLSTPSNYISFVVNNTWECSLRCTHCSVLTQLEAKQKQMFNVEKFVAFANKFIAQYNKTLVSLVFVGGEALLYPQTINAICEALPQSSKSTTTNLAYEMTEERIKALSHMNAINVSIDGLEEEHNKQRIPYKGQKFNPFTLAIDNLKILIKKGLKDKIHIQGALKDEYLTKEYLAKYLRFFLKLGIKNVTWGCIHTTDRLQVPSKSYLDSLKVPKANSKPCCAFRSGDLLYFDSDEKIWNSYWTWSRVPLGTLDDAPETIMKNNVKETIDNMPCLKDSKCLECPALGICWGGCVNGKSLYKDQPSRYCNQEGMIKLLNEKAQEGSLIKGVI